MPHPTLEKLANERKKLVDLVSGLSEAQIARRVGEGWTIREVLTHLLNAEEDHCKVVALVTRGRSDRLPTSLDLDAHNEQRLAERGTLSLEQLLAALEGQRQRTIALFESLSDEQLEIVARHPVLGEQPVGNIFRMIGLHERAHVREIATALKEDGELLH